MSQGLHSARDGPDARLQHGCSSRYLLFHMLGTHLGRLPGNCNAMETEIRAPGNASSKAVDKSQITLHMAQTRDSFSCH